MQNSSLVTNLNAFLHIEIAALEEVKFKKPITDFVRKLPEDITQFDIDNHSDAISLGYATQFIQNATKIYVMIDIRTRTTALGGVAKVMDLLCRKNVPIRLVLLGRHTTLETMGKTLGEDNFFKNLSPEEQEKSIEDFFMS
ncbi:MAG: hypothetical protein AAFX87_20465 [Bacteroidota bacterium]